MKDSRVIVRDISDLRSVCFGRGTAHLKHFPGSRLFLAPSGVSGLNGNSIRCILCHQHVDASSAVQGQDGFVCTGGRLHQDVRLRVIGIG